LRLGIITLEDLKRSSEGGAEETAKVLEEKLRRIPEYGRIIIAVAVAVAAVVDWLQGTIVEQSSC
jgi:hypothetical protein